MGLNERKTYIVVRPTALEVVPDLACDPGAGALNTTKDGGIVGMGGVEVVEHRSNNKRVEPAHSKFTALENTVCRHFPWVRCIPQSIHQQKIDFADVGRLLVEGVDEELQIKPREILVGGKLDNSQC